MAGTETMSGVEDTLTAHCRTHYGSQSTLDLCEVRRSQQSCLLYGDFLQGAGIFFFDDCNDLCSDLNGLCIGAY